MSVKSKSDTLPGSVSCIFCNKNINFLNEGKQKFFNHLRDEHMIFLNHDVVLAVNFLDKDTLQVIVKQFETSYFRIMDNKNEKDNQRKVGKAVAKKVEKKVGAAKKAQNDKNAKKSEQVKNVPKVQNNKVKKVRRGKASKNNRKDHEPGKIKMIETKLLQEPHIQTETTIIVEDDEPLKHKKAFIVEDDEPPKVKAAKASAKKTIKNNWSIKTHFKSVQKRKSISTIKNKKVPTNIDLKQPKPVQKHSFVVSKSVKRLNRSIGSKASPQGKSFVKTLAKNNNKEGKTTPTVLSGLAGITVTKYFEPKPSKVINLSTDNMAEIKQIAKNSNLSTSPGFSCSVCGKKFNTEERYKKHTTNCVKSILVG